LYLDNILPDAQGMRKPFYYFLTPSYWGFGKANARDTVEVIEPSTDQDVVAEEKLVQESASKNELSSEHAVEVRNLICNFKTLFSRTPFYAVKGPWYRVANNQLFALLGPNGAGKTTTINMLTGVIPPSAGNAYIFGHPISTSGGMNAIRSKMGVCPQFDILWEQLTAREHLHMFSRIIGVPRQTIVKEVENKLDQVKLTYAADLVSMAYSGGMRRRLSVAISLLGDPRIVFLDEPTTGMDPISRRHVWDIIESAKRGRAVILTTHSMEEADILGDRIAIMARGRLRCIGSSIRLKNRFGAGIRVSVSSGSNSPAKLLEVFNQELGLQPTEQSQVYTHYIVPRALEGKLPGFFSMLENRRSELGLTDMQFGLCTLEDVFLNIARAAEEEYAAQTGKTTYVDIHGQSYAIPTGSEAVQVPGLGLVQVKWGQDADGNLIVVDVKTQTPSAEVGGVQGGV